MNDSKFALSNLTKSRWLRLSASVGLAFGLAVVMLLLPLAAGTSVTLTVPALTQLSSPLNSAGNANWSLGSTSIEVDLPFGVQSVSAIGGVTVVKTSNVITAYQGGKGNSSADQPGVILYTIVATNNTGSTINGPFYLTDTVPAGTVCLGTSNQTPNTSHNTIRCQTAGIATLQMNSTWPAGTNIVLEVYVVPDGKSGGYLQSLVVDDGAYTVTNNSSVQYSGPTFNGGNVAVDTLGGVNIQTAVKAPVWDITKTAPATVTSTGGQVTYTLNIANSGVYSINPGVKNDTTAFITPTTGLATTENGNSKNRSWVTITEWLPSGVISGNITYTMLTTNSTPPGFVISTTTATTTKITWVITDPTFSLEPGQMYATPFTVAYTTVPTLPAGYEIVNSQYKVEGGDNVYYPDWGANVTTTVQGPGYLTVTKYSNIGNTNPVTPGGTIATGSLITYTIKFTYGSAIASVMITDVLPVVTGTGFADFQAATLATNPSGLLVNYLGGATVSCTGGTTGTVTTAGSPVNMLWIKAGTGTTNTVCTAWIPTQMRSFMPNGLVISNSFSVAPVVSNIASDDPSNIPNGAYNFFVVNPVLSDNAITVTKTVFPTVIDPNSSSTNITYSLIITNGGTNGNGWDSVLLSDDLYVTGGYTWAVYLGTKPNLITVSKDTPAPITYSNSQLTWDEVASNVVRVITAGTNLNDRFFQLKAKVITKTPMINNGVFCNDRLNVNATHGADPITSSNTACVTVVSPQISVTKMANWAGAPSPVLPGGQVVYSFTITNSGNVTVNNLVLTDAFASGSLHTPMVITTFTPTVLAAGQVATATFTYTVVAGDVDTTLNAIYNSVTATALASIPGLTVPPSAIAITGPITVPVFIQQSISMTKLVYTYTTNPIRASLGITLPTWGDTITYSYIMTNNSTFGYLFTTLTDDTLGPVLPTAAYSIPPLSSVTYTKTMVLNDASISKAILQAAPALSPLTITNIATATGSFQDVASTTFVPTATTTVEITYTADVMLVKTADVTTTTIGSNVNYTLFITNTGSVTLGLPAGVVSDSLWGDTGMLLNGSPVARPASALSPLAPGASTTIQYTLPITQGLAYYASMTGSTTAMLTNTADITLTTMASSATLTNFIIATVSPTSEVTDTDSFTVAMVYTPSITLTKSVTPISATIGTVLNYSINVMNNGTVDLTNITVTDYLAYSATTNGVDITPTVAITSLAAGASTTYNYTITVDTTMPPFNGANFDSGALITNTAMVTANFMLSPTYGSVYTVGATNWNTITTSIAKDLQVIKTATWDNSPAPAEPGDVVTYTYTLINNGTLAVTATLFDDRCQFLDSGVSAGCLASDNFTQDAIVNDQVISSGASLMFTATSNVDDELIAAALRQTPSSLTLINTAWAKGTLPGGFVTSNPVTASVPFTYTEDVQFSKSAVVIHNGQPITTSEASVGDIISYTLVISNNGNIGYQDVSMTDVTVLGQGAPSACADYMFAPQRAILQGYVITPSTVFTLPTCAVTVDSTMMAYIKFYGQPASTLVNTATVMVTPSLLVRAPAATNILGVTTEWATASVVLTSPTQLLLSKVPSVMTATVGDIITYTYYITNAGSVDFSIFNNPAGNAGVTLWDDKLGTIPTGINVLSATASTMVEATHVVTFSDYNVNSVVSGTLWLTNSAVATGYVAPAFGTSVPSVPALAKVALDYTVDVSITKTSDKDSATVLSLGEPIVYTLTLQNNGSIPVTVTLKDVYDNGAASQSTDLPASVWLGANGAMTNVVYHDAVLPAYLNASILTQTLRNVVTATANDGLGNLNQLVLGNVYTDTDDEILTAVYDLNVVIAKSTTTPMVYFDAATKTVTYQYVLTNTGKTTQTASLVDWFQGYPSSLMTVATVITLPPNVPVTTTASFSITDAYLDNGIGPNQAVLTNTARAYVASGSLTVPFDSNPVTVTVVYTPVLSVLKSANLAQARVGDTITYTILVANNGLVTLRDIIFEDRLLGVRNLTSLNMSPGGVPAQFVVSKTITLIDLQTLDLLGTGAITNTANVTGTRGTSDYGFDSNTVTVKIVSGASLTMTKIGSATSVQVPATVTYTYMVTNNGTVDISNISLTDNKLTLAVAPFTLTRDAVMVVTASTTLTQPNVAVTNIATANATFSNVPVVATATWTINTTSGATCTVSVNAVTPVLVGQASAMTATLSPAGSGTFAWAFGDNSTGTGVNVSHVYTAAGTYPVTVTATSANGETCTPGTTNVVVLPDTGLTFLKTANPTSVVTVTTGSNIVYNLTVTNTSASVVNGVVITDTLPTGVTFVGADHTVSQNANVLVFTIGDLQPNNDFETVMVTVTVNAASGPVVNSAVAGSDKGSTVPSTVSHNIGSPVPNLQITKTSERPKVLQVGTLITYTIRVTNSGDANATQVVISDTLPAGVTLVGTPTTVPSTLEVGIVSKTVVVTASTLGASDTASVNIVVRVNDNAVGLTQIVNTAFVSSLLPPIANSSQPKVDPADTADSSAVIKKPQVPQFLPIILKQPDTTIPTPTPTATSVTPTATPVTPQPGLPNLQSKIKLPASVAAGQAVEIEIVVTNVGGSAITDGFWVDFYINPNDVAGLLTRGGRWDSDENNSTLPTKQGIAWEVKKSDLPGGSLAPNGTITLVSRPVGDAGLNGRKGFDPAQTTWSGSFVKGTSTLVSYADSYAGSGKPAYLVVESSETDNANRFDFASALGGVVEPDFSAAPFHPAR